MRCVLTALAALHGHGFVHRDVRWPNVLAGPSSTWLLADWELAAEDGAPLPRGALRDALLPPDLAAAADGSAGGDADGALGPYVAADDVWAVGRLLQLGPQFELSPAGAAFGWALTAHARSARPTAAEALAEAWVEG